MRGCWRLLWRDPAAFEDFNITVEGFWRSFAMIVPVLVLAYPMFISDHQFEVELCPPDQSPPLRLGRDYFYLLSGIAIWPLVTAGLARLLGTGQNYVRYMIVYNWMAIPTLALSVIPHLFHLATGAALLPVILAQAVFIFLLYVSWLVAKAGLQTTAVIASVFVLADFILTYGLDELVR